MQQNVNVHNHHRLQFICARAERIVQSGGSHRIIEYAQYAWLNIRLLLFLRMHYTGLAGHRRFFLRVCMVSLDGQASKATETAHNASAARIPLERPWILPLLATAVFEGQTLAIDSSDRNSQWNAK